jgi:hypothetical protein
MNGKENKHIFASGNKNNNQIQLNFSDLKIVAFAKVSHIFIIWNFHVPLILIKLLSNHHHHLLLLLFYM